MAHKLLLTTFAFKLKKSNTKNSDIMSINNFLDAAYPKAKNKFEEGFLSDVVGFLDKTFKTERNTHGALLLEKTFSASDRTIDLMINGGLTGIKQFMIDEEGRQSEISEKNIVGLKFFVCFWLPAQSNAGYIFMQHYDYLSIRPVYEEIIKQIAKKYNFSLVGRSIKPTTTEKRLTLFKKHSRVHEITVISKKSKNDTSSVNISSTTASIRIGGLVNIDISALDKKKINSLTKPHGFSIDKREYIIKAKLRNESGDSKEDKTVKLDNGEDGLHLIPRIELPSDCFDVYNHPIFKKMKTFVREEIEQIKLEAKL